MLIFSTALDNTILLLVIDCLDGVMSSRPLMDRHRLDHRASLPAYEITSLDLGFRWRSLAMVALVSSATKEFLQRLGVNHRVSSAYNPQSNGRAEVAVKTAKRLLRSNTGPSGSLDTDRFLRAMMHLRNTPDRDCDVSPAQIVFGRPLRDAFAFASRLEKFTNENIRPLWRQAWVKKEEALRERFHRSAEKRNEHSRSLPDLVLADRCYIQNQTGNHPNRWDRSGTVVEVHGNDSYTLKVDGTGRVTRRNRRYLRRFLPASPEITSRRFTDRPTQPSWHDSLHSLKDSSSPDRPTLIDLPVAAQPVPAKQHVSPAPQPSLLTPNELTGPPLCVPTPEETVPVVSVPGTSLTDPPDVSSRPRRSTHPPARYEPETGRWV